MSVTVGGSPVYIRADGDDQKLVTNVAGGSVSYGSNPPFVPEGTVAVGSTVTLTQGKWFVSASSSILQEEGVTLDVRVDAVEAEIAVTDEKVWLQDSTLSSGPADNTGTNFVNDAFNAAIARALTATGNGKPVIGGKPGTYKWDMSEGGLAIPGGVRFSLGSGTMQAASITFTETNQPCAVGVNTTSLAQGATSVVVHHVREIFPAASVANPQPVLINNGLHYYTNVSQTGSDATLTLQAPGMASALTDYPKLVVAGAAVLCATTNVAREYALDQSIKISGPYSGSSAWKVPTPPTGYMDGIWVAGGAGINCSVGGFRKNVMYAGDHETFGGDVYMDGGWCNYACESPLEYSWADKDSGNQMWKSGSVLSGGVYWCQHYISAGNCLLGADMEGQSHQGNAPWWMWKANTAGVTGAYPFAMSDVHMESMYMEGLGLGVVGCADNGSSLQHVTMRNGAAHYYDFVTPSPYTAPVAAFAINFEYLLLDGFNGLSFISSAAAAAANTPMFIASAAAGKFTNMQFDILAALKAHPPRDFTAGGDTPRVRVELDNGVIQGGFAGGTLEGEVATVRAPLQAGSYRGFFMHQQYSLPGDAPAGVAVYNETGQILTLATNKLAGLVTAAVRVQATPPTAPSATADATAGTLPAATYYYKVAAVLSGGGTTGASSEVSVALSGSNSASLSWTAPASPPHGQTILGYRIYRGTAAGAETGWKYKAGTGTTYIDSGATLTAGAPTVNNVGCEVYFSRGVDANGAIVDGLGSCLVRAHSDGATYQGKVCTATGPADPNGPIVGQAKDLWYSLGPDNGSTVQIIISPALS